VAATSHDDLFAALDRFPFITSTDFISRLEALALRHSPDARGPLLERVATLRHLAGGKPLNAKCNPLFEAFAAIRLATAPGDERMLLRLYPFLQSASIRAELQKMAAGSLDSAASGMLARITRHVEAANAAGIDGPST